MTPVKMSKADPKSAERAAEHFAVKVLGCVKTIKAVKAKFQWQDLFGSDVIGKDKKGYWKCIQVTTGKYSSVYQRRKKMEAYPWQFTDTVMLLQMIKFKDDTKKLCYAFKIYDYFHQEQKKTWSKGTRIVEFDKSWFKALKNSK